MKREASAAADLHDLEARTGPVRPGWLWGLLAFVTAATLTAFALALSSPFGANGLDAIPEIWLETTGSECRTAG